MRAKRTIVELVAGDVVRAFEFSHAERLLRMRKNGGWHLPADSKFEFDCYGLHRRRDKEKSTRA